MKNPISAEYLETPVTITPEQLGEAITRATKKEVSHAPAEIREKLVQLFLGFGATIMVELLCNDLGLIPDEEEDAE